MVNESPPNRPQFFIDRNLGSRLIKRALIDAGYVAHSHDDFFEVTTTDIEWLSAVGEKGWIVLSMDKRILENPAELMALVNANVFAFFVRLKSPSALTLADAILGAIPSIEQIANRKLPPHVGIINKGGIVNELQGYDRLVQRVHERIVQLKNSRPVD